MKIEHRQVSPPGISSPVTRAIIGLLLIFGLLFCMPGCGENGGVPTNGTNVTNGEDSLPVATDMINEPPVNPFMADSPWPMTHRNAYCQASSPYPGPTENISKYRFDYMSGMPFVSITLAMSGAYPDGSSVLWAHIPPQAVKLGVQEGEFYVIDKLQKELLDDPLPPTQAGLNAAYTVVDCNNTFFAPNRNTIVAYGDEVQDDAASKIVIKRVFEIPSDKLYSEDDLIVGLNMLYDGMLAFVTNKGTVGVVSRSFDSSHFLNLGEVEEEMSNSIACDEDGGIYVVTSERMYRVQWTGDKLTTNESEGGWTADYETGGDIGGVRLGKGSGATPSLMGTGEQDKFVVITDGQELMHTVLFWRDEIPSDWVQIPGTRDRRIAAQIPVTFGDPEANVSSSEQSPCVRGYGVVIVNNQLAFTSENPVENIVNSQDPDIAPYGAEKFVWDPQAQELYSAWANENISLPNGIPSMSSATNMLYDIGQRGGNWTWEALDWDTGESVGFCEFSTHPIHNSCWAATEIGFDGDLYSSCMLGVMGLHRN